MTASEHGSSAALRAQEENRLRWVNCEDCGGLGEYETRHPMWGSPFCPEAYITVICATCEGTGRNCVDTDAAEGTTT